VAPVAPTADRATALAEERTDLAVQRNYMAAERTLMAWIRTSLSMISFGFTIAKVFEHLVADRQLKLGVFSRPTTLGLALVALGTVALVVAVVQHRQTLRYYGKQGVVPAWSLALAVATVLAILGVFAFGSMVLAN
jgi:putative membrane protein